MLTMIGTLWPLVALPVSILLASRTRASAWRWAALIGAPASVYAIHYWLVLPFCLQDGNLLAAVMFGGMIAVGAIYFPAIIVAAGLCFSRRSLSFISPHHVEPSDAADSP